ncbi:dynamin family protein [Paenibacillus motobuensis]|uniref:dynamin family protein n=3 Tax=Paenibacillus motobuensis TaxID=295324 RepID=UPI00363DBC3C
METITNRQGSNLHNRLVRLGEWYKSRADGVASGEIEDLLHKLAADELTLAFCGHFSAGKSSLINMLCGKQVLSSGPIPTTANIAALRNGAPQVRLTKVASEAGISKELITLSRAELDEYCRDGNTYAMIEIWDEIKLLENGGVLLDTPGVDSGEAAHMVATNSALHLADVVFYVMDYNHVLSESNLSFARRLADWGKPLYLVVNQIDKHRENELTFADYRKSVEQAFELWGIVPAGVFHISLKELAHPLNMLERLTETITHLQHSRTELLEYSINCSIRYGAEQFIARTKAEGEEREQELLEIVGGEAALQSIENELSAFEKDAERYDEQITFMKWVAELDSLLNNSYIMNPSLRAAAEVYLESRRPEFKTGFLFHRGKTQREQERRKGFFMEKLAEQTAAQVDWHVRDLLRKLGRGFDAWDARWEQQLDERLPQLEESWITEPIKEGAMLSGEYTLRYATEVAAGIAGRYKRAALSIAEGLLAELAPRLAEARQSLAAQRETLLARSAAAAQLEAQRSAAGERTAQLMALCGAAPSLPPGILPEVRDGELPALAGQLAAVPQAPPGATTAALAVAPAAAIGLQRLTQAAAVLEAAAAKLSPYPAFGSRVRELRNRAAGLAHGRFTVALFGAFSAGKSSFANALLGASVLPVSPHPTTAAINRILAPEDGMEHGTGKIMFKTQEAMQQDLADSFEALQLGTWKERTWIAEVDKLRAIDVPATGRAHYSFLKAAAAGWGDSFSRLGTSEIADLAQFASYVSVESKACFVERMDLYYSCPLTEQGIVIVDTPGADSIHARHTGVTFQYMKNCDALIYVTYYNHAFSRADRQFLTHLGRVKGSFALDKMYFIVNAADLAATSSELASVVEHVEDGLRSAGVESPQIYPVSSLQALTAKGLGDNEQLASSGFVEFESAFFHFLGSDLAGLAVQSAERELKQMIRQADQWAATLAQGQEARQQQQNHLREDKQIFQQQTTELAAEDKSSEVRQEVSELLYHVRQRLRLLAGDLFTEYFHPVLLQDDGGDMKRKFAASMHEWLSSLTIELQRELQVTCLRAENRCIAWLNEAGERWIQQLQQRLTLSPALSSGELSAWSMPEVLEAEFELQLNTAEYWPYFKNPKSFFEGGGRKRLREAVEEPLSGVLKEAVDRIEARLSDYYCLEMVQRFAELTARFNLQWEEWEQGLASLSEGEGEGAETWLQITAELRVLAEDLKQ